MSDVDNYSHHWYTLGLAVSLEEMAERLRSQAGTAFATKKDHDAELLRRLADETDERAKKLRAEADKSRDVMYPGIKALDLLIKLKRAGHLDHEDEGPKSLLAQAHAFAEQEDD